MGSNSSRAETCDFPELYYLHRRKSTVLHINEGKIFKLKFSKRLRIRSDSVIGYLPSRKIMVCGGTDSSGCLTNKVFIIDPIKLKVKNVSALPAPSKSGYLIEYRDWVYYAGGLSEITDEEAEDSEAPSRLMRYNIAENYWEIFPDQKSNSEAMTALKGISKQGKNNSKHTKKLLITDLYLPTVCLFHGKLYFFGGETKTHKGKLKPTYDLFSVDISQGEYELKLENVKLPFELDHVVCTSRGHDILITGGKINGEFNKESWNMTISKGKAEFTKEPEIPIEYLDSHPSVYDGLSTVLFAFPDIIMLKNDHSEWEKTTIFQKTVSEPTLELNKVMRVDMKKRKKSPVFIGKDGNKQYKRVLRKEDSSAVSEYKYKGIFRKKQAESESESEEEKINPFPTLEAIKNSKKATAFSKHSSSDDSD